MLNIIWVLLLAVGIVYAALHGNMAALTGAAFDAASAAVVIVIEICGIVCLWMGLLKVAEASGLVKKMAKLISPLVSRIFPDVPKDHPAFFAMIMNIAANMLGLGNAATPFGLKAMEHLQELNPDKDRATPAMITFLAINTAGITLLPTLVISLRAAAGSMAPGNIILATIIASSIGTVCVLLLDWLCRRRDQRRRQRR